MCCSKPIILCVDDEKIVLSTLAEELQYVLGKGFEFEIAQSGEEALELMEDLIADGETIALVFSDYCMPGMGGLELLPKVKELAPGAEFILLTGMDECCLGLSPEQKKLISGYIPKPWNETVLRQILGKLSVLQTAAPAA